MCSSDLLTGLVDRFLCAVAPEQEPAAEEAARLVELIAADPCITRVDTLARRSGMSSRTLQRLYAEYVGVVHEWSKPRGTMRYESNLAGTPSAP